MNAFNGMETLTMATKQTRSTRSSSAPKSTRNPQRATRTTIGGTIIFPDGTQFVYDEHAGLRAKLDAAPAPAPTPERLARGSSPPAVSTPAVTPTPVGMAHTPPQRTQGPELLPTWVQMTLKQWLMGLRVSKSAGAGLLYYLVEKGLARPVGRVHDEDDGVKRGPGSVLYEVRADWSDFDLAVAPTVTKRQG